MEEKRDVARSRMEMLKKLIETEASGIWNLEYVRQIMGECEGFGHQGPAVWQNTYADYGNEHCDSKVIVSFVFK